MDTENINTSMPVRARAFEPDVIWMKGNMVRSSTMAPCPRSARTRSSRRTRRTCTTRLTLLGVSARPQALHRLYLNRSMPKKKVTIPRSQRLSVRRQGFRPRTASLRLPKRSAKPWIRRRVHRHICTRTRHGPSVLAENSLSVRVWGNR